MTHPTTDTLSSPSMDLRGDALASNEPTASASDMIAQDTDYAGQTRAMQASRCNIGRTEQKFRIAAGTGLLAAAAFAPVSRGWRVALGVLGAAELITGTTRYCPVSQALGINTCRGDEQS